MMFKHFTFSKYFFVLLLLGSIGVCFASVSYAVDYFVDGPNCTGTGNGTSGDPFCYIVDALATASTTSGDTVYVRDGIYEEQVSMKSGVALRNAPGALPQITTATAADMITFSGVNNSILDGFIIDASGMPASVENSVVNVIGPTTGISITNCEIKGAATAADAAVYSGIKLGGQIDALILDNTISNVQFSGISTGTNTLVDSSITIQGNTIIRNGYSGIHLVGSLGTGAGNSILIGGDAGNGNIISNNGAWSIAGSGIRLSSLQGVTVNNNVLFNNGRNGMLFESVDTIDPHITNNTIYSNFASGINIGGNSTMTVGPCNEIFDNGFSGITFFTADNPPLGTPASSAPVTMTGNGIHTNAQSGISVMDHVTGKLTIQGNSIYQNEKAGIAFFNSCTADIIENSIYDHTGAAGIFTGTWDGSTTIPPLPSTTLQYNRANGPVMLTINRNKVHNNYTGMRLDHASGTISNNLVHHNARAGIRFSGNDSAPFGATWGISSLTNNTVAGNGTVSASGNIGAGIVYDDITNLTYPDPSDPNPNTAPLLDRYFYDWPEKVNVNKAATTIQNNIVAYSAKTGIRDADCYPVRDYNLYYGNNTPTVWVPPQIYGCNISIVPDPPYQIGNPNEFFRDPLFVDQLDYRLQSSSPGKGSGSDGLDMGAYGGINPIN